MSIVDVFQRVACLLNDKKGLDENACRILTEIEILHPGTRAEYLNRLARRARHHKDGVDQVAGQYANAQGFQVTNANENQIRDFHHNAYYAAFFVARYALVSAGCLDSTAHREIDDLVTTKIRERQPNRRNDAEQLAQRLDEWRAERNIADYTMSPNRLPANPQLMTLKRDALEALFVTWGVP